jgi:hypothetical protein
LTGHPGSEVLWHGIAPKVSEVIVD